VRSNWLLAIPQRAAEIDSACWRPVFRSDRGTIFRRMDDCA
jgi:hypothetical protein